MAYQGSVLEAPRSVPKRQNNIGFLFLRNHINPHNRLPLSMVTFGVPPRRYLRKEVGTPTSQSPTPIQDSEPPRDQEEKDSGDETEVRTETNNNEVEEDHTGKIDKYNHFLDLSIALRKCIRSYTNHSISNYVSYENLSPRAFTASLDSTIILKNILIALECPEWKNAVMEEMKAF
ncbi:reverse transcriptase [Cucumis melo var. makuwa]|uniref:Reverse transcriptase n=1 Tax=Cucumis melo var. makuwa TaxID=1194695 RepID=A0A5D3DHY3_CUCMM|nr:reverse transcriptase [Cucumis melo var. makuwa]